MTTDKEWRAIYIMEIHMCERSERYNVIDTTTKKKRGEDAGLMECYEDFLRGLSWLLSNEDRTAEDRFMWCSIFNRCLLRTWQPTYRIKQTHSLSREPHCSFNFWLSRKTLAFIHSDNNNTTIYFKKYEIFDNQSISISEILEARSNLDYIDILNIPLKFEGFE